MHMSNNRKSGWSLIELTIILTVLSVLCAILAPTLDRFFRAAQVVRAREDTQMLGCAIQMFIRDTANMHFMKDGNGDGTDSPNTGRPDQGAANRVDLLVSDGDIPVANPGNVLTDGDPDGSGATGWTDIVDFADVDFLEYHLVTNNPGNDPANHYRTPRDLTNSGLSGGSDAMFAREDSKGFNAEFSWRGPYVTAPIDPDPWGNRYAVNVKYLDARADGSAGDNNDDASTEGTGGFTADVVVLSAGSDEEVDTNFNHTESPQTADLNEGAVPGDDDIIYLLSANSRP